MKVLDCESIDSCYVSLEEITGVRRTAIERFLDSLDLDAYYEKYPTEDLNADDLLLAVLKQHHRIDCGFDATCWFHLTRVSRTCTFEEGVLSLGERLDPFWDSLYALAQGVVTREEWLAFRRRVEDPRASQDACLYNLKVGKPSLWGPYAMLIRDVAFTPKEMGNHYYLGAPEIVEDICGCFRGEYRFDLLSAFMDSTHPCIVKFRVDQADEANVGTVLLYLYRRRRGESPNLFCNNCFDAGGKAVPPSSILKIEFPEYRRGATRKRRR